MSGAVIVPSSVILSEAKDLARSCARQNPLPSPGRPEDRARSFASLRMTGCCLLLLLGSSCAQIKTTATDFDPAPGWCMFVSALPRRMPPWREPIQAVECRHPDGSYYSPVVLGGTENFLDQVAGPSNTIGGAVRPAIPITPTP